MKVSGVIALLSLGAAPAVLGAKVSVTGVPVAAGAAVPYRLDINQVVSQGGAYFDLYIQALNQMQTTSAYDQLSYFQIAGIHGKPYIEYNGAGGRQGNGWAGYCPHGEKIFGPWHRPFLMLFEQTLVARAKSIANGYPSSVKTQYVNAANSLRAPFWDWSGNSNVPQITTQSTVSVTVPNGSGTKKVTVNNPLYQFKFPQEAIQQKFGSFPTNPATQMCPSPNSYPGTANSNMAKRPYKRWTCEAFETSDSFTSFMTTGAKGTSLEQIHNGVHWDAGCAGQFLDSTTSAFPPIFFLHHAHVDRLYAYWQYASPKNNYWSDPYAGGARYSTPQDTSLNANSPLQPFFQSNGQFHTSSSVVSLSGKGYTYEGLEYWRKSSAQLKSDAIAYINTRYGCSSHPAKRAEGGDSSDVSRYVANIELDVTQVQRPCQIDVYVLDQWAGNIVVMQQPEKGITHGAFSIDNALLDTGLPDLIMDPILSVIENFVKVEITKVDGSKIDISKVPSLKVDLELLNLTIPDAIDELPKIVDSISKLIIGS